ncbi:hypothetical protein SISNIDRAFT_467184 [Sistotremastrum niveocremeum HHB9708]|uniref:BTB domain-containing protein n=1 Tax=Sistotremastrum niveocremeum HHB9708 TaxID=1314777 RepID=A0A164SZD6_9AGAM|nr:hypothetical protein SISNIDRAFT_467184 [Sistotremastrum niveocremeum HHB9708]
MSATSPPPGINPHPPPVDFDNAKGDAELILFSSDQFPFFVHKWPLAMSSPIFSDMLTIGDHHPKDRTTHDAHGGLLSVQLMETGETLEALLRVIYPLPNPAINTIELLSSLTDAAVKYDVGAAISYVRSLLLEDRFLSQWPLRVYAIAKRYSFSDVEDAALKKCYGLDLGEPWLLSYPETKNLGALDLHKLIVFKQKRTKEAIAKLPKFQMNIKKCRVCHQQGCAWWPRFYQSAREALEDCPSSEGITFAMMLQAAELAEGDANTQCSRNCEDVVRNSHILPRLKASIDALPWEYGYPKQFGLQKRIGDHINQASRS